MVSSIQINDSAENEYSITENGSYEKFSVEFENDYDKLNEEKVAFQIQNIQDDLNVVVGFVKTYNLSLTSGSDAVVKAELKHENQSEPDQTSWGGGSPRYQQLGGSLMSHFLSSICPSILALWRYN